MKKLLTVLATAFILTSGHAADALADPQKKVQSDEIVSKAKARQRQEVLVEIDDSDANAEFHAKRKAIEAAEEGAASASNINNHEARSQAFSKYQADLLSIKQGILAGLQQYNVTMVSDLTSSPLMVIAIDNQDALASLINNPLIKHIWTTGGKVKLSANWPTAYTDLSLIKAPNSTFQGQGVSVAILDSVADFGMFPLIGSAQEGGAQCAAGQGGNCRAQYEYSVISGNFDICGMLEGQKPSVACPSSIWQHGTIIGQIISRVAPKSYLWYYQIVDDNGQGSDDLTVKGLDQLIHDIGTHNYGNWIPPSVVNMSFEMERREKIFIELSYGESHPSNSAAHSA